MAAKRNVDPIRRLRPELRFVRHELLADPASLTDPAAVQSELSKRPDVLAALEGLEETQPASPGSAYPRVTFLGDLFGRCTWY